jgi:superfamily II DNA or RNA helicase
MTKVALLADKLYVPIKYIDPELHFLVATLFVKTIEIYLPPSSCSLCYRDYYGEVPCDNNKKNCPYNKKKLFMFEQVTVKGEKFLALWRGDIPLLKKSLKNFKVKDIRSTTKVSFPLDFKGSLRVHQKKAIAMWAGTGFGAGMIKAPARSGKTVIGVYIALRLGLKTLVLSHQGELLDQFYDTFKKFTNLEEVARFHKNPVVKKASGGNIVDLVKADTDIILAPYQTFISKKGQLRLKEIRNYFGLVIVDEVHLVGAPTFSQVVTKLNSFLRLGLTATPDRKDGRDILAKYSVGPVVSEVKPKQMAGKAYITHTDVSPGKWSHWPTLLKRLSKSKTRNRIIVSFVKEDVKKGHKLILITDRRDHVQILYDMIKEQGINVKMLLAGIPDRKQLLVDAKKGKIDVVVATRKLARYGLDVPPWSAYYCLTPINNEPNFYQEMSRVRTPYKGKKEPIARIFVDKCRASFRCSKSCEKVLNNEKFIVERVDKPKKLIKEKKTTRKKQTSWSKFNLLD